MTAAQREGYRQAYLKALDDADVALTRAYDRASGVRRRGLSEAADILNELRAALDAAPAQPCMHCGASEAEHTSRLPMSSAKQRIEGDEIKCWGYAAPAQQEAYKVRPKVTRPEFYAEEDSATVCTCPDNDYSPGCRVEGHAARYSASFDAAPAAPEEQKMKGADHSYQCGCYWFCGNLIACQKHSPYQLKPCDCGCGKLVEGGLMERAHPEDYRYERG